MFEKNDLVSLNDNKEYLIIDIVVIDEKKYIYLMDSFITKDMDSN